MRANIGVIGAMDSEVSYLVDRLEGRKTTDIYGYSFHSGSLYGKQVTVMKCGIGKVNAARGTQLLIDRFSPDAIVNTGIAGALDPELNVGDAVIATGLVQHDFNVTAFGHVRGYICTGGDDRKPTSFAPDEKLIQMLRQAARRVLTGSSVTEGVIATGDLFVADAKTRRGIRDEFSADAVEMEGAAIAQTASYSDVPFAVLRVVSDSADCEASESYDRFEAETAKRSAAIIEEFLKRL
jgi:adenosylhomocysteine nucleosidase